MSNQPDTEIPLNRIRRVIAREMKRSLETAAQVTITTEADMSAVMRLRDTELSQRYPEMRISINDIVICAVARALRQVPITNSTFAEDKIIIRGDINIGIAVATPEGLIVPVLKNADQKNIVTISQEAKELVERARKGGLTLDDISGGTFTVTNLGMFGIDFGTPILRPPESGILMVGSIRERPVVIEGAIQIRSMTYLSLTHDHRCFDGKDGADFLQQIKDILTHPETLL
ncbi:MAG: 2-oxo acid dehydrogenase subunit E2 [Chloroflexi bacterium]|nr:2-oxo acid dehydrogenase subunit E2 [Chloroflexota bacterium]MCL5075387.1 2-oxo acid dehydrogenase subunit E2 [Chloroflexota bacterium]